MLKAYFDVVEKGETAQTIKDDKTISNTVVLANNNAIPFWKKTGLTLVIQGVSLTKEILKERRGKLDYDKKHA